MEEAQQKVSSAAAESSNSLTTPRKKLKKPAAPAASASAGQDETVKSSLKPKLRIKRNNTGTWIIFLFSVVCDVIFVLFYNFIYTYQYGLLKGITFVGTDRYMLFVSFISLVAVIFSIIFTCAVLSVSSLTMQKQKRIKMAPYVVFSFFKLILFAVKSSAFIFLGLFIKDILLYVCMSHTAKNPIVRKFFKPFKQVVYYE